MTSELEILALGLLLGVRHAFDADHLVAVTTIVSEYRNPLRAVWIGVSWGLGHTTTLFLAGGVLLLLNVHLPERLTLFFEFLVGIMLVLLGIQTLLSFRRHKIHIHEHRHSDDEPEPHKHFHLHETTIDHKHRHSVQWLDHHAGSTRESLTPFFRLKSYIVGTVHGLAGSAALMLLVLANVRSAWVGLTYLLVFGLGTVVSMGMISIFINLPFSISGRIPQLSRAIQTAAGAFSIVFGLVLMYQIGIAEGFLTGI